LDAEEVRESFFLDFGWFTISPTHIFSHVKVPPPPPKKKPTEKSSVLLHVWW